MVCLNNKETFILVLESVWETSGVGYYESVINDVSISDKRIVELRGEQFVSDEVIICQIIFYSDPIFKEGELSHTTI